MQKKWLILNVFVLAVVVAVLVWIVWIFSFSDMEVDPQECIDVNKVTSFVYDACYDAYSKNIFLDVKRSPDSYKVKSLDFSFFDFKDQFYSLEDVPNIGSSRAYKIPAERNPQNIDVVLDIVKDFTAPICKDPRKLFVRYCSVGSQEEGVNVSISPLEGVAMSEFIEVTEFVGEGSDILGLNLVEKERVWKSQCESSWNCEAWESCDEGVQKRKCVDTKECFIPTDVPETVQYCDNRCVEDWECMWSDCNGGFTVPECKDLNSCGTSYQIPQKLECGSDAKCVPDIQCGEWSSCEIDYNFMDLTEGKISDLTGSKSRFCADNNNCAESEQEVRNCSVNVDIYTKRFSKCGEDFIGIYDRLDNGLIARISEGSKENPYLNIDLGNEGESPYCDYCFDGRQSGDEEGIDCGGSCMSCEDKYKKVDFKKKTIWARFIGWIGDVFD